MGEIVLLSSETIDKIAAGEVVEKPLNVVKELVENSIDAGATAVTVEIKGGGTELIRVTDNGCGIDHTQCKNAFLRHATSKIKKIEDLDTLSSLGFRGEALSSICAVSKVEMITKTKDSLLGTRTVVEGGKLLEVSDVGAPEGTTILVRSLFYNTPPRKKFLKSPNTEAALIEDMVEKFALSNPGVAIQLIINGKTKISTAGNNSLKDAVYHIFGKDVYNSLLPVDFNEFGVSVSGFTAKPEFSYQSRNGELYFVNGRYVKSKSINTGIEEVYRNYLMQHRFPFCVLFINVAADTIDVNVHPQKLEVKFSDNVLITDCIINALNTAFNKKELIPETTIDDDVIAQEPEVLVKKEDVNSFARIEEPVTLVKEKITFNTNTDSSFEVKKISEVKIPEPYEIKRKEDFIPVKAPEFKQESLFEKKLISDENIHRIKVIGQLFETYWIMELDDEVYFVDQHAAHEKVNYEHLVERYNSNDESYGQMMNPPLMVHLNGLESETLKNYMNIFKRLGFEIDDFGMGSFAIRCVPINLYGIDKEEMFNRLLDELMEKDGVYSPTFVCEKLASMSCKAAIKGNQRISVNEFENLMQQVLKLENPYNCPHGRPVFIKLTKAEMEKKFKRIV